MNEGNNSSMRWWMLAILAVAELLGMSLWMTGSAVSRQLAELWELSNIQSGLLTTSVQFGFVIGTLVVAVSNLADLVPSRVIFVVSCIAAAACNGMLLIVDSFHWALVFRLLTGMFLAGVYPPAMKMIATWFTSGRGLAIGTVVGALTIGKATPFLVDVLGGADWQFVVWTSSIGAMFGAGLVAFAYREGPHTFERRPFSLSLCGSVVMHRPTRLAIGGYLGHMWELYAMWTWIPAFVIAAAAASNIESNTVTGLSAFAIIAIGGVGCVWGGMIADRIGRENLVNLSMAISGLCCLLIGFTFGLSFWLVLIVALVWGFFVVADSAQFSTLVTEVSPRHAVGTALSLQTSIGFLLTTVTMQVVPWIESQWGWRWAFTLLAVGPVAGILAIQRLKQLKASK